MLVLCCNVQMLPLDSRQGEHEARLINDILDPESYNPLARPAHMENESLQVEFGLTLLQIVDVVRCTCFQGAAWCGPVSHTDTRLSSLTLTVFQQ